MLFQIFYPKNAGGKKNIFYVLKLRVFFANKAKVDLGFFFVCGHTQSVYGKIDSF